MRRNAQLEEVQRILALYADGRDQKYRLAEWLRTDFDSEVWLIETESSLKVDWRIHLEDGELLTSAKHRDLWNSLRCWLIAQTHPDSTGGKVLTLMTTQNILYRCLHCIDFFLLRAEKYSLATHGLTNLTGNDIKAALSTICSDANISVSIYQWPAKLTKYLRDHIRDSTLPQGPLYVENEPAPDEENRLLDLTHEEVREARRWLHASGNYKCGSKDYRWVTDNPNLARAIYPNTIWAASALFPKAPELCLDAEARFPLEYRRAPVTSTGDDRMTWRAARRYGATLRSLRLLSAGGIPGPTFDLAALDSALKNLDLKENLRFLSLPYSSVMKALRQAIEYFLENGEAIVEAYLAVCERAQRDSLTTWQSFESLKADTNYPCEALSGINSWALSKRQFTKEHYFSRLRTDPGLHERITILIGSIRLVVGALTARRSSEISSLRSGTSLDVSRTRLVFTNRKSGIREWRQRIARPVPPIAVRMIELLDRLHDGMVTYGAAKRHSRLFSTPWVHGRPALAFDHSGCLDRFCDWAETDLDPSGRRYYIRHHQLRRFFATLFFYGDGFGGIDTLRWFLGHIDAQHVWHYITENVPGAAIRSVAADFAAYQVKHNTKEAAKLYDLLAQEFGATDFTTIDDGALTDFLYSLMDNKEISIEPQFLDHGRSYRIAIVLHGEQT